MVETTTKNYGWTKPEITKSASTWGGFLNGDLDAIDALVFANQQGIVPIGSGALWFSDVAPANWMICDGRSLDSTNPAYAALFAVIGYKWGGSGNNFNLPNPLQRTLLGANPSNTLGSSGGSWTYTITTANLPSHTHPAAQDAHTHAANQDVHSHYVYQDAHTHADSGHQHGTSAYQDAHTHGGNIMRFVGSGGTLGVSASPFNVVSGNSDAQQPAVHVGIATDYAHLDNRQPAVHADNQQPAVHIDTQQPAVHIGATGGGAAMTIAPQFLAINFIIRYR